MPFATFFKTMGTFLLFLLEAATVAVLGLAVLLAVLLFKPQWIINESNLRTASNVILPRFGVDLKFKTFKADFPETAVTERSFHFAFEQFSLRTDTLIFRAEELEFGALVDIHPNHPGILMVGPTRLSEGLFVLDLPPVDPYEEDEPFEWNNEWVERIRRIKWQPVAINFDEVNVTREGKALVKGSFGMSLYNNDREWNLAVDTGGLEGTAIQGSRVNLDMQLPADIAQSYPLLVKIDGFSQIAGQGRANLKGNLDIQALDQIRYNLTASLGGDAKMPANAKLNGFIDKGKFATQITAAAKNLAAQLPAASVDRCRIAGDYSLEGPELLDINTSCEIAVTRTALPQEEAFSDLTPKEIKVFVQGPTRLTLRNKQPYLEAKGVKARITPIENAVYKLTASVNASFEGLLSESMEDLRSDIRSDASLEIPEFQKLVARLEPTPFAIPAPFHTLKGSVGCGTQGRIVNLGEQLNVPLTCNTALSSSVQAIVMDLSGAIQTSLDKKPRLQLDVLFKDLALEMPKLRIEDPIPQFVPDNRIRHEVEKPVQNLADQSLPIELDIHVRTEKPALLQTHVVKNPIPIEMDIKVVGDKPRPDGRISIKMYEVELLKRKALVERFDLILNPAYESPELDGLFVFLEKDFRIELTLKGSTEAPYYYLESDPPRSPTELLSMIMFGDSDALAEENLQSAEQTRAAMVDGALGLLSMYYLASTPIDSVGYNPYTGVFRARVSLGKGLSLSVGSDIAGGQQSVGLKKRLTETWSFETTAETDEETNESKGVALFKWDRRY